MNKNLSDLLTVVSPIAILAGGFFAIYKWFPKIKVQIKPVPDNFDFGWIGDASPRRKWTHRLQLDIFNHGFNTIIITQGELEVSANDEDIYIDILGSRFRKQLNRNESYLKVVPVSDLKLPPGCKIKIRLKTSKGKTFKSDSLSLDQFDPYLNPL